MGSSLSEMGTKGEFSIQMKEWSPHGLHTGHSRLYSQWAAHPGFNLRSTGGSLIFSFPHTLLGMWPCSGGKQAKLPWVHNFEEALILKFTQVPTRRLDGPKGECLLKFCTLCASLALSSSWPCPGVRPWNSTSVLRRALTQMWEGKAIKHSCDSFFLI